MASEEEPPYVPKDAIRESVRSTMILGAAGTILAATQNTLARRNYGPLGMFTHFGSTIVIFASAGATFEFTRIAAANLREKDDSWNPTIGGFVAGAILGLRARTMPAVLGFGAGLAVIQGVFAYGGGGLEGWERDPNVDEYERKERLRKERRRPIEETLRELGEGRGIYGPGYEERRRERIKQKYGIDVPTYP